MASGPASPRQLYLDLLKLCLTRLIFPDCEVNEQMVPTGHYDRDKRLRGQDWPSEAETMIGLSRLTHLEKCVIEVLENNVPGDLVETGVWRGGASILMRAVLKAYGDFERTVWLADSFEGLPRPNACCPADTGDRLAEFNAYLGVSLECVQANFARYGLHDGQVRFLEGWFHETLPAAPIDRIAVLRLDGDMYQSTMDALVNLYSKISVGGYLIIDDYGAIPACKAAIHDFRDAHQIVEPIQWIDWTGAFWKRAR